MFFFFLESCSHSKSQDYYAESLSNNDFYAYKCRSFRSLKKGDCEMDEYEMMGYYVSMEASGKYYLEVDKEPPYATGPKEKCDD